MILSPDIIRFFPYKFNNDFYHTVSMDKHVSKGQKVIACWLKKPNYVSCTNYLHLVLVSKSNLFLSSLLIIIWVTL